MTGKRFDQIIGLSRVVKRKRLLLRCLFKSFFETVAGIFARIAYAVKSRNDVVALSGAFFVGINFTVKGDLAALFVKV